MSTPTRLAISGLGLAGKRHANAIAQLPNAELVGVVEPTEHDSVVVTDQTVPCFRTLHDLLTMRKPDGVILSTPTALHINQALECVGRGCPVLVEKPLATSATEAHPLIEMAKTKNVPVLVGYHRRYNPLIQKARELIVSGTIGDIRAVQITCWFYKPDEYFDHSPWRKKIGAGPISVNLAHDVDLIRHLCGEVTGVQALATPASRGYENEDVAVAVMQFHNGALGTLTVSDSIVAPWSWELTAREYPIYPPTPESCYLIGGSHGSISLPDLRVWNYADGNRDWWRPISTTTPTRDAADPLVSQIAHFVAVIRDGATPVVSGHEGLRSLQLIEAIQQATGSGSRVELPLAT